MSRGNLGELYIRLQSLAIFRAVLKDPVIGALCQYLQRAEDAPTAEAVAKYAEFAARLYDTGKPDLAGYVQRLAGDDENPYIRIIGRGEEPWPEMVACVREELAVLQAVADLTPEALREGLDWKGYLPGFQRNRVDIAANYRLRCEIDYLFLKVHSSRNSFNNRNLKM